MLSDSFKIAYKKLNPAQRKAVDTIEGPVMVIAGPGTGKTSILTLRIANILTKTDATPDSILALTFTESGVRSMRKKLADIIGSAAYKVCIYTFHEFCNDVIQKYPEEFPRIVGSKNATDIDQIKILEIIIDSSNLPLLKPYGDNYYYINAISKEIRNLKRENISPEEFADLVKKQEKNFKKIDDLCHEKGKYKGQMKGKYETLKKSIDKNKELCLVYEKYQEELEKRHLYDYEDMIMEAVKALDKKKNFLLELQENYQYILADEHQDANNAQNKLLELLSNFHDDPNLFIVGDEKQAIYRFQGASLENFLYFKKLYPSAVMINLEENYRSTQNILDAAHSLISKNPIPDEKLRVRLKSKSGAGKEKILFYEFSKPEFENAFIAGDIESKINNGTKPGEIAVLYRNNRDALDIIKNFEKTGVPFSVFSDSDLLSDDEIKKAVILLEAVNDPTNEEKLAETLFIDFLNLPNLDTYKILNYKIKNKLYLGDLMSLERILADAGVSNPDAFKRIFDNILKWSKWAKNKSLVGAFEEILKDSGFVSHLLSLPGSLDKLLSLDTFFSEVRNLEESDRNAKVSDFIAHLDLLKKHEILIRKKDGITRDRVNLMTAHKSKGLEFEYVYVTGAREGHWGNNKKRESFHLPIFAESSSEHYDANQDERRLFYVAITRAKKQVAITCSKENSEGKIFSPSQFVAEIHPELIEKVDVSGLEKDPKAILAGKFSPKITSGAEIKDKEFLNKLFLEQGLNVSALNNYLTCPWQYFFRNLVRLPSGQEKWQMFGTAIHAALKDFFDKYKEEKGLDKKTFISFFESHLSRQPLSEREFEEALEKGKKALSGYFDFYKGKWERNLLNEFNISGVLLPLEVSGVKHNILLKGKLDKIEIGADGINVVDYKTGKQKSRNEIEGNTKSSNGDIKRQLIFYKILLDDYDKGKYKMTSGEIDFVEPDEKGKYRKEKFFISDEEANDLRETIKKATSEILSLSFWDKTCGNDSCEYCALRKSLK